ncbi:hypothetical protein OROGR_006248 [Orobanche gracilis]
MSGFPHDGSVPTEPRVAQTESIRTAEVDRASSPTEHTEGVHSPSRAVVPVERTLSLDHQLSAPTVTPSIIPSPPSLDHQSLVPTVTPIVIPSPPSLDHQSLVPTVTPPVISAEMLVTPPEIVHKTRQSSSSADLIPIPFEYSSVASRADIYHSHKLQYRSYRPHSPFSSTVVRKRKDLDEEAYCRWLDSNESASWFLMLHDGSKLIDAEHLDAYMGILQFDPSFVGVRWLDDWAVQTVLVHTSFL